MNTLSRRLLILSAAVYPLASFAAEPAKTMDPFEEGMRDAYTAYKKGDNEAVTAKLRELLKIIEDKGAAKVSDVLPETLEDWKGESLKRDDLSTVGGGLSLSRTYTHKAKQEITVKVVKDSPLVKQLLPFLANEELLRLSNRKTHAVSGETAVMEGDKKLQLVVDKRIYVELVANDASSGEKELLGLARKLDLNALAKMK
ncbi:hypothetical protein [Haloferula sp. BvORR071]|uniref:hypothetical protein n=1 Tax=Haloferula sp. BvORR071 TaxID=1396141 RepID=UPI000552B490|nr:hypothetical protein [Haloferula sp. BvORR071]